MKNIAFLILFSLIVTIGKSQSLYKATSGEISFFSKTPVEDIEAINKKTQGILKPKTNEIVFVAPIVSFHFEKPLMEEHFNENYMESDKGNDYKTAIFKGKIIGDVDYTKDGEYKVTVKGTLKIHAVTKEREIPGTITVKNGKFHVNSKFQVKLKDHDIAIPKLVIKNIAEVVDVTVNIDFEKKK